MSAFASALYQGQVVHQRFAPRRHRLRYRLFQMLFDLDELPALNRRLRLFSHNRFNAVSFHDADHGDGDASPPRAYVERTLARAGLSTAVGRIALLCMPRIFGHVFNPLSIYYCHDAAGDLMAMLYEVNNTFGQRHSYLIPVTAPSAPVIRQSCAKAFYVSPFMDMAMTYAFGLTRPGPTIATTVNGFDAAGSRLIFTAFIGRRRALSDGVLLAALAAFPLSTLGVVVAIHWEAVKLLVKGMRPRPRPAPPAAPVTLAPVTFAADSQNRQSIGLTDSLSQP